MDGPARALDLLGRGRVTVKGRLPGASNVTLLAEVALDGACALAVYKPLRGERPLWDFPRGLFRREVAAYLLSEALGWGIVPPTVERQEAPLGEGSLQLFVEADVEQHYFTLRAEAAHRDRLQRICAFDLITNNADRKGGHCLLGADGAVHAIDNGLTFHVEPKLRTVIWDFAGDPVPAAVLDDLRRLVRAGPPASLASLVSDNERAALVSRARRLVAAGRFPTERGGWHYPWPIV